MPDVILEDFVKIGEDIGEQRGLQKGLQQGLQQGLNDGLAPLARLFARRLNRPLSEQELQLLVTRLDSLGANRLGDVVLDLDSDALQAWLTNPSAV